MSDFSVYVAQQVADWMSQGTVETPPSNIYVTVFDDTGTELDGSFIDARAETTAETDWDSPATDFENANEVSLGEATEDVTNITDVALYDAETDGNELARYQLTDAPFDVSDGSTLLWQPNQLTFDVIDRTE